MMSEYFLIRSFDICLAPAHKMIISFSSYSFLLCFFVSFFVCIFVCLFFVKDFNSYKLLFIALILCLFFLLFSFNSFLFFLFPFFFLL